MPRPPGDSQRLITPAKFCVREREKWAIVFQLFRGFIDCLLVRAREEKECNEVVVFGRHRRIENVSSSARLNCFIHSVRHEQEITRVVHVGQRRIWIQLKSASQFLLSPGPVPIKNQPYKTQRGMRFRK